MGGGRFGILVVCTANICRSPMIERMLRHRLQERLGDEARRFAVTSAGTWGHDQTQMHQFSERVLTEHGMDAADFMPRELAEQMVGAADLVLTAARDHRAAVVTLVPRASRRAFTLLEFARLLRPVDPADIDATDPVDRARALVEAAAANRGLVPLDRPQHDELPDPIGRPLEEFRLTAKAVTEAVSPFLDRL